MKSYTLVIQIDIVKDKKGADKFSVALSIAERIEYLVEHGLDLVDLDQDDNLALYNYTINVG